MAFFSIAAAVVAAATVVAKVVSVVGAAVAVAGGAVLFVGVVSGNKKLTKLGLTMVVYGLAAYGGGKLALAGLAKAKASLAAAKLAKLKTATTAVPQGSVHAGTVPSGTMTPGQESMILDSGTHVTGKNVWVSPEYAKAHGLGTVGGNQAIMATPIDTGAVGTGADGSIPTGTEGVSEGVTMKEMLGYSALSAAAGPVAGSLLAPKQEGDKKYGLNPGRIAQGPYPMGDNNQGQGTFPIGNNNQGDGLKIALAGGQTGPPGTSTPRKRLMVGSELYSG